MSKVISNSGIRFVVENDLEEYRVNTLFDKEPETIAWISRFGEMLDGAFVFFDIGVNIGIYSMYCAHLYPENIVYSFEPVLNNYAALVRNIKENNFIYINPFNLAVSDEKKLCQLFIGDLRVGNSGAQINAPVNDKGNKYEVLKVEQIMSLSVDQLIAEYGFPVPNFIKIDVDGHEQEILNGMMNVLKSPELKSLLVEFNDKDQYLYWRDILRSCGLEHDSFYDDLPNHSDIRRKEKGSLVRNYIFTRFEN